MKIEGWIFGVGTFFYALVTVVYFFMTREIVGTTVLLLTSLLAGLIGFYILYTAKRVGSRPEDRDDAEIDEADPDYGFFSPHSWWPLPIAFGAMVVSLGLVFAAWLAVLGVFILMFGVLGLVYEYYIGDYAH